MGLVTNGDKCYVLVIEDDRWVCEDEDAVWAAVVEVAGVKLAGMDDEEDWWVRPLKDLIAEGKFKEAADLAGEQMFDFDYGEEFVWRRITVIDVMKDAVNEATHEDEGR